MPSRWVVINTFVDLLCLLRQTVVIRWFLRFSKREVLLVILNRKVIVQVWLWGGESGLTLKDALVHFRPAASVINILFYISVADNSACCVFYDAFEFQPGWGRLQEAFTDGFSFFPQWGTRMTTLPRSRWIPRMLCVLGSRWVSVSSRRVPKRT